MATHSETTELPKDKEVQMSSLKCRSEQKCLVKTDAGLPGRIIEVEEVVRPPRILVQVFNTLLGKKNRQAFKAHTVTFMVSIPAQARYSHDDGRREK